MDKLLDAEIDNIFKCIMTMSEEIYQLAQGCEWTLVYDIESKRHALVEQYFKYSTDLNKEKQYSRAEELMVFNKKLIFLAKKSRHDIRERLRSISENKKASGVYKKVIHAV